MRSLLVLLAACGTAPVATDAVFGLQVDAVVVGGSSGSALKVTVSAPADTPWTATPPEATNLTFSDAEERVERLGDRAVTTRTYPFKGRPGPYVISPICATVTGSDDPPACSMPLYIDVGVKPDRSAMADIAEPSGTWPAVPWAWVFGGLALAGLVGAYGLRSWQRRPEPEVAAVPTEPPHLAAIRQWEAIRDDATLSDFDKALGLSEVFRAYAEAALSFPARAYTTTETLAHLASLDALPKMNVPRARRLLRATDRVKYAEAAPGSHFFDDLEADLHAFIDQTRPHSWETEVKA